MAFGYRNFAVGTAYSKTDAMQAAVVSAVVLGEVLTPVQTIGGTIMLVALCAFQLRR